MRSIDEQLLEEIGAELGYIESDFGRAESRIRAYVLNGMAKLNNAAGAEIDYESDRIARALLVDYCRYANSHATELFESNYLGELIALNDRYAVEAANE